MTARPRRPARQSRPSQGRPPLHPRRPSRARTEPEDGPSERLQKVLAAAGLGSRRDMEDFIRAGRIKVNGTMAMLGMRVTPRDRVVLDGREIRSKQGALPRVLLYHKPEGEIVSRDDPEGRPSVFERIPRLSRARWLNIGRLDFNTSGLLLFTTWGELAHRFAHPRFEFEREYAVRTRGELSDEETARLKRGVDLDDGPARVERLAAAGGEGANRWYRVVLSEGRNRIVRRLFEAVGHPVSRLIRVRFGPVLLPPRLRRGQSRELTPEEVTALLRAVGVTPPPIAESTAGPPARRGKPGPRRRPSPAR